MNINNLGNGQILKNYKELCEMLDIKVSAGNTKKAQLKELERFCIYHKEKTKFIIDTIYSEPLPKEDNKRNSIYSDYVEKLIIHMLSNCPIEKDEKTINMSRNGLYYKLHMINKNYNTGRNNINSFSRYLEIPITTFYDFYNNTSGKLKGIVERTLNKLQSKCLIKWEYRIGIKLRTGSHRLATDNEIDTILETERKILKQLNEESKKDIFLKGKWNDYNNKVCEELQELTPIDYYYKVFHVNTTKDFRKMMLETEDLESIQNELNATIYLSTIQTAETHYNNMQEKWRIHSLKKGTYFGKPKYENEQTALRSQYIDDTKRIADTCIDFDTYDLRLDNVTGGKYTLMEALMDESNNTDLIFLEDAMNELFN